MNLEDIIKIIGEEYDYGKVKQIASKELFAPTAKAYKVFSSFRSGVSVGENWGIGSVLRFKGRGDGRCLLSQ